MSKIQSKDIFQGDPFEQPLQDLKKFMGVLDSELGKIDGKIKGVAGDIGKALSGSSGTDILKNKEIEKQVTQVEALKKKYEQLTDVEKKLQKEEKEILAAQKALERQRQKGLAAMAKQEQAEKDLIAASKMEVKSLEDLMKKNNALVALRKKVDLTTAEGRKEFQKYTAEIANNDKQLKKYDTQIGRSQRYVGGYKDAIKSVATSMVGWTAIVTGAIAGIKALATGLVELDDRLADVRKTTNLTGAEVRKLYVDLLKIDTRTSQDELLGFARIAGKLGVEGSENIQEFVKAIDNLQIAIGEDLGGDAEETARQLGKLVEIFKLEDIYGLGEALTRVGNVINFLGMTSTANEAYIVDFTKRMAGIAPMANMSITDIMGFASSLDILGQSPEVASTALGKLLIQMGKEVPKFAGIAGMSINDFSKLIKTDANEALLRMLKNVGDSGDGLVILSEIFDELGVDAQRSTQIIGALAGNVALVTEEQAKANKEFQTGNSTAAEAAIRQNTLGGTWSRIGRTIKSTILQYTGYGKALQDTYSELDRQNIILEKLTETERKKYLGNMFLMDVYQQKIKEERDKYVKAQKEKGLADGETAWKKYLREKEAQKAAEEAADATKKLHEENIRILEKHISDVQKLDDWYKKLTEDITITDKTGTFTLEAEGLDLPDGANDVFNDLMEERKHVHEDYVASVIQGYKDMTEEQKRLAVEEYNLNQQKKADFQNMTDSIISNFGQQTFAHQAAVTAQRVAAIQEMAIRIGISKAALKEGLIKTLAKGFPENVPLLIAFLAQTAGLISSMVSIKFREGGGGVMGDSGLILDGKSHEAGGIPLSNVEAEDGEYLSVINRRATRKYRSELPIITDMLNKGIFEKKYKDVSKYDGIVIQENDPYNKKLYELMKTRKEEETQYMSGDYMITKKGNYTQKTRIN